VVATSALYQSFLCTAAEAMMWSFSIVPICAQGTHLRFSSHKVIQQLPTIYNLSDSKKCRNFKATHSFYLSLKDWWKTTEGYKPSQ